MASMGQVADHAGLLKSVGSGQVLSSGWSLPYDDAPDLYNGTPQDPSEHFRDQEDIFRPTRALDRLHAKKRGKNLIWRACGSSNFLHLMPRKDLRRSDSEAGSEAGPARSRSGGRIRLLGLFCGFGLSLGPDLFHLFTERLLCGGFFVLPGFRRLSRRSCGLSF